MLIEASFEILRINCNFILDGRLLRKGHTNFEAVIYYLYCIVVILLDEVSTKI